MFLTNDVLTNNYQDSSSIYSFDQNPSENSIQSVLESFWFGGTNSDHRGAMPIEIKNAKQIVHELGTLDEDWDGYGAIKLNEITVRNAINSIDYILNNSPLPEIFPNPNGTISLEWENTNGVAHLEIGKTKYSFYLKPRSGLSIYDQGNSDNINNEIGLKIARVLYPNIQTACIITSIESVMNERAV